MNDTVRFRFRAARPDDLDVLERFAAASADGITTLPEDRDALAARLARAAHSFATDDAATGEEIYMFVVEDLATGRVVGTSGIAAAAGHADRFYSFRNEVVGHSSPALGATNRVHALRLCHDLTGVTLLTSFYVDPEYADGLAPQLLSRARLLFIAQFADRFAERIAAESPGLADDAGRCPFWDAVGRKFFDMDYPAIERIAIGRSRSFIAALMPSSPVYVSLLPEEAQWAIGQLHPVGELPFSILVDEGFDPDTYVDIFDGGPIVQARAAVLKTLQRSRIAPAEIDDASSRRVAGAPPAPRLVATTRRHDFRAILVDGPGAGPQLAPDAIDALGVSAGEPVRWAALDAGNAERRWATGERA
jgi:arginine N-succinyltransferase